ncbi:ArsC/Spx/MgsR family protein [Pseudoponticoccus marisrubri]|uniref:Arsenate reductase n=1 Tax=Pseudoponticoccus marisrubri TaxID=1685382 RepID=A0A0W7WNE5_9RHOB|nr:ArsC/Spx/MgsR family protein [Pseudoponticoccus marisrubri]KUF12092.1 arsenate reductase [Pseudoponticoccus marisrubri]
MKIHGLKTCDTCRMARKALPEATFVDLRDTPLSDELLDRAIAAFPDTLVNRRSTTWRGLDAAERDRPVRELLRAHPTLMKRPLIEEGTTLHLGWDAGVRSALLGD